MAFNDTDGLGRAFTDAGIADSTRLRDRVDGLEYVFVAPFAFLRYPLCVHVMVAFRLLRDLATRCVARVKEVVTLLAEGLP